MCQSNISLKKFLKLYGEILFYRITIWLIFIAMGYESFTFSLLEVLKKILPFYSINTNFVGCFIAFWLCIPFLNILIHHMTEKQHIYLTMLLLFIYTVLSVLACTWVKANYNMLTPSYFLNDSNKILAVWLAFSAFMFFKNVKLPYSKVINAFGASTFGVLLIHANSNSMRKWLWKDGLDNVGAYSLGKLLLVHSIGSVLGIFLICSLIDMCRIRFVEKPLERIIDRHIEQWIYSFRKFENRICVKLNISTD